MADAQRLVNARNARHLSALSEAGKAAGNSAAQFQPDQHSVASRFFEVRGTLQVEQTTVQEYSVVQRDALEVKTLWRQRGAAGTAAPLQ